MPEVSDRRIVVNGMNDILSSYEREIQAMGSFFDTAHDLLSEYQNALAENRAKRELFNTQIRDILAKNEHLRKKDFDSMMHGVFFIQEEQEKEIMALLQEFLNDQKTKVMFVRENLMKCKDSFAAENDENTEKLMELLNTQGERKKSVISKLKELKKQQENLSFRLQKLFDKGKNLKIKDFKLVLSRLQCVMNQ